jgi:hypothetical protein
MGRARVKPFRACAVLLVVCMPGPAADEPSTALLTGGRFRAELERPVSIARDRAELRPLLERVSQTRGVAIVLDRRVDPSMAIEVHLPALRLRDALSEIAGHANCIAGVVGDTVFVGPRAGAGPLRTLIALRETELDELGEAIGGPAFELRRARTIAYEDLELPAELLQRIAGLWGLDVAGLEQVPHDLWAGGTLAGVNAVDALSLVLVQFDLTFAWTEGAQGIRIVPVPQVVALDRVHDVRRITVEQALSRVRAAFPELDVRAEGRELHARGSVEQHEAVARLARGESAEGAAPKPVEFGPLARRRFTFEVVRQPVRAVLEKLIEGGLDIEYDAAQLEAAGIDLSRKLSFHVRQATVDELFETICEPAGLQFEVRGESVVLRKE